MKQQKSRGEPEQTEGGQADAETEAAALLVEMFAFRAGSGS